MKSVATLLKTSRGETKRGAALFKRGAALFERGATLYERGAVVSGKAAPLGKPARAVLGTERAVWWKSGVADSIGTALKSGTHPYSSVAKLVFPAA